MIGTLALVVALTFKHGLICEPRHMDVFSGHNAIPNLECLERLRARGIGLVYGVGKAGQVGARFADPLILKDSEHIEVEPIGILPVGLLKPIPEFAEARGTQIRFDGKLFFFSWVNNLGGKAVSDQTGHGRFEFPLGRRASLPFVKTHLGAAAYLRSHGGSAPEILGPKNQHDARFIIFNTKIAMLDKREAYPWPLIGRQRGARNIISPCGGCVRGPHFNHARRGVRNELTVIERKKDSSASQENSENESKRSEQKLDNRSPSLAPASEILRPFLWLGGVTFIIGVCGMTYALKYRDGDIAFISIWPVAGGLGGLICYFIFVVFTHD